MRPCAKAGASMYALCPWSVVIRAPSSSRWLGEKTSIKDAQSRRRNQKRCHPGLAPLRKRLTWAVRSGPKHDDDRVLVLAPIHGGDSLINRTVFAFSHRLEARSSFKAKRRGAWKTADAHPARRSLGPESGRCRTPEEIVAVSGALKNICTLDAEVGKQTQIVNVPSREDWLAEISARSGV